MHTAHLHQIETGILSLIYLPTHLLGNIFAHAGRLIEEKGVMKAIEAIDGIHGKNIHLIIAGSGPLNTSGEPTRQNERIHFVGKMKMNPTCHPYHASMLAAFFYA
ncbi:MAG: hypothetical protein ACLU7D_06760 [Collinsella sp.]